MRHGGNLRLSGWDPFFRFSRRAVAMTRRWATIPHLYFPSFVRCWLSLSFAPEGPRFAGCGSLCPSHRRRFQPHPCFLAVCPSPCRAARLPQGSRIGLRCCASILRASLRHLLSAFSPVAEYRRHLSVSRAGFRFVLASTFALSSAP